VRRSVRNPESLSSPTFGARRETAMANNIWPAKWTLRTGDVAIKQLWTAKPSCPPTEKGRTPGASGIETAERWDSSCTQKRSWIIGQTISDAWCRDHARSDWIPLWADVLTAHDRNGICPAAHCDRSLPERPGNRPRRQRTTVLGDGASGTHHRRVCARILDHHWSGHRAAHLCSSVPPPWAIVAHRINDRQSGFMATSCGDFACHCGCKTGNGSAYRISRMTCRRMTAWLKRRDLSDEMLAAGIAAGGIELFDTCV